MSTEHHAGRGYAPLPQSISNTDTEDEEECLTRRNETRKEHNDATTMDANAVHKNGVYYPLDETRNLATRARNGQSTLKYYRDDIPIMMVKGNEQNDLWKRRDMSPIRRFCLAVSILLCIATIIVFLYVLPCDNSMVCPPIVEPQSSISYDKTLQGVELHGPISIIHGSPYNLIFLLRGQRFKTNETNVRDQRQISSEGGGVMSMQGNTGLPLWLVSLKRMPTEIDCVSIDTDGSGKPDCIVAGEQGLLVSIEPIAGTIHWSSKYHTFPKLPVILPDIDSDGINDFLSIDVGVKYMPSLVLLSGATGQLIAQYSPGFCSSFDIYNLVYNDSISYVCHEVNGKRVMRSMSFKGLLHAIASSQQHKDFAWKFPATTRMFEALKVDDEKHSWRPTPYHRLSIENEGTCPGEFCKATLNLTLQKLSKQPVTIWSHVSPNSLASQPAFMVMPGKPYTSGFAVKFWQWVDSTLNYTDKVPAVVERKLIERVLIVLVNYTDMQVMNVSQSDITQVCRGTDCQPNLNARTRFSSIAIANISNDGFPELISYWSSYDVDSPKVLTSKVQVVKLDSIMSNLSHAYT